MNAGPPDIVMTATITPTGVLTVWGLDPSPLVLDESSPTTARNELVNLLHAAALERGHSTCAAARTPAGPWYVACDVAGMTSPVDPSHFADVILPELDPEVVLAGTAAVFAAAADSPPVAMLALATDPDPAIRTQALAELANWPDDPTSVADAELPADRLERLARCDLAWVRVGVAANPGTARSTLADLVATGDPQVLAALAARFDLPVELILMLASVPDPGVQAELARNPAAAFLTEAHPVPAAPGDEVTTEAHPVPALSAPHRPTAALGPQAPTATPTATPVPGPGARPPITTAAAAAPTPTRPPRRVLGALGAAAAVVLLTLGGYTAVTTLGDDLAPTAAVSATVPWNGMSLPTGPDGPADPAGDVASGFAHTEAGAAMAAAHLSVRIDAYAGPASFEPTITDQDVRR